MPNNIFKNYIIPEELPFPNEIISTKTVILMFTQEKWVREIINTSNTKVVM